MRKILTSVLSVAGLLAVVLALASSPASAAKEVITVQTADPGQAGIYTVSWETQGGCDPGEGTSGASGSISLTVTDSTPTDDTANTGAQQETGVVTDDVCNYSWDATFTNAAGAGCIVGTGTDGADPVAPADATSVITLTTGACATTGKLLVTVKAPGDYVGDCISAGPEETPDTSDDCDNTGDGSEDTGTRPAVADDVDHPADVGAVSATTFTITATPQKVNGNDVEGCEAVSEDTEINYENTPNLQEATLTVVDQPLGGASCIYTVTAVPPAGFAAGAGGPRDTSNLQKDVNPSQDGPDGTSGNDDDGDPVPLPSALLVSIADVKVYLVQNVIGDAGGAGAEYKYEAPCGAPGLPGALSRVPETGGISTIAGKTVVELRTGRFNISEALPDGSAADGTEATALNEKGEACEATVSVSGVPAHCSVSHNSPASLASASGSVIIEVTVDCSAPAAPEPPVEEPMDDMGGDDMGGDDMGGDDMGGDDMGGDDMGGDDMGDMGPPEDVATG